jgi:predicted metal-dependent phosphoesterase TrpH
VKNLLIFVVVLAVAIGGLGYWRGWFSVSQEDKVQVDPAKFKQDKEAFSKTAGEKAKAMKDQVASLWQKSEGLTDAEKASAQTELRELQKKHDRLEQQIKELDEAGQDRFESIKQDLSKNLKEVEEKIKESTKKLEKKGTDK